MGSLILVWLPVLEENSEFKPVKPRLKFDFLLHPSRAEGLGKYMPLQVSVDLAKHLESSNRIQFCVIAKIPLF